LNETRVISTGIGSLSETTINKKKGKENKGVEASFFREEPRAGGFSHLASVTPTPRKRGRERD